MAKPISMEFDLWTDKESMLILEIQKLKGIDIRNQEEIMAGIEIFELFDKNLYGLMIEHGVFFDEIGIGGDHKFVSPVG